jgi:hypothetical protein
VSSTLNKELREIEIYRYIFVAVGILIGFGIAIFTIINEQLN